MVQHGVCGAERLDQNRVRPVARTWALENPGLATTPDKGKMQSGETRIHRIRLEASIRGFLAATVKKMAGVTLLSEKAEGGPRRYRIEAAGE